LIKFFLSFTPILSVSQLQSQQLMTSLLRSRVEYLMPPLTILVLLIGYIQT